MKIGTFDAWQLIEDGIIVDPLGLEARQVKLDVCFAVPGILSFLVIEEGLEVERFAMRCDGMQSLSFSTAEPVRLVSDVPGARVRTYEAPGIKPSADLPAFTAIHQKRASSEFERMMFIAQKNAERREAVLLAQVNAANAQAQKLAAEFERIKANRPVDPLEPTAEEIQTGRE